MQQQLADVRSAVAAGAAVTGPAVTGDAITGAAVIPFPPIRTGSAVFTSRDLIDMQAWHGSGCRVAIEYGLAGRDPDCAAYALIYHEAQGWADWGLTRNGPVIIVWNCRTLADVGRFGSMREALAALPCSEAGNEAPAHVSATIIRMTRPRLLPG